jgi:dihydroneopterin aldolase / 2-amino-4-hydroxy-6-hydroxymethyldihydropteridine diphosphokinase / dihydropteroate synthase
MIPDFIHPVLQKSARSLLTEVLDPSGIPMNKVIPFPRLPVSSWECPYSKIDPVPATLTHWTYTSDISSRKKMKGQVHTNVMATLNVTLIPSRMVHCAILFLPLLHMYESPSRLERRWLMSAVVLPAQVPHSLALKRNCQESYLLFKLFEILTLFVNTKIPQILILASRSRLWTLQSVLIPMAGRLLRLPFKVGANCINDVYAFTGPSYPPEENEAKEYMTKLTAIATRHAVPVVLMHSRGDANINKDYTNYGYAGNENDGMFVEGVRVELGAKVEKAIKEGVRRWLIVADPGIDFGKPLHGDLEVFSKAVQISKPTFWFPLGYLKNYSLDISWHQDITPDTQAKDQCWSTAARVSSSMQ